MPKTIEDRMEDLGKSNWRSTHGDAAAFHHHEDLERAIIAGWNAAAEMMRKYISDWYWRDGDEWQCGICHAANNWHEEWHIPGSCYVASAQAALAQMEGTDDQQ